MKKAKHKYKLGDKLEFKYFDGGVRQGIVTKLDYVHNTPSTTDWSKPTYTITTYNNNPKLRANKYNYPCIQLDRILCKLN